MTDAIVDSDDTAPQRVEFLVVTVGGAPYALELGRLRRVVDVPPVTRVPRAPELVDGVTRVDGEVAVVIDARRAFGRSAPATTDRLVLLDRGDESLGLVVDGVEGFETVHVSRIVLDAEGEYQRARIRPGNGSEAGDGSEATREERSEKRADGTTDAAVADEGPRTPVVDAAALFEAARV